MTGSLPTKKTMLFVLMVTLLEEIVGLARLEQYFGF
jgi:hypothetical protein